MKKVHPGSLLFLVAIAFFSCNSNNQQYVKAELIDPLNLNAGRLEYTNFQMFRDANFYLSTLEVSYSATHADHFIVLINKKNPRKVLKFIVPPDVVGRTIGDNLIFTKEAWNSEDKWVEIKKNQDTTYFNWDTIPPGQLAFNKEGIYKYENGNMNRKDEMLEPGVYFASAFSVGVVKKYDLGVLKKYWH